MRLASRTVIQKKNVFLPCVLYLKDMVTQSLVVTAQSIQILIGTILKFQQLVNVNVF